MAELAKQLSLLLAMCPQRPARDRLGGNHVLGAARLEYADRQRRRPQRVDAPARGGMQGEHRLAERQHRVAATVRVGAVRRLAPDLDLDRVARGVHRPLVDRHRAPSHLRMNVRRDDGARPQPRERLLGDHLRAGGVGLLARLEDREQRRRQLLAERRGGPHQRDQRRHVDVVAACVHRLSSGAEVRSRRLSQRQPVELRSHPHRRAGAADERQQPSSRDRFGGDRQRRCDRRRGGVLPVGELRGFVQAAPQRVRSRELRLQGREQRLERLLSRPRHTARRSPRVTFPRSPRAPPA